ncbi:unnamed protein product [Phytomonas sp. Hart1]|nr:unnamed protein product [Phytomonas sp. Hart1]|eukprot:CCW69716.1 unnamed protein product [Phytomonas sp. isolate Hart1]
MDKPCPRQPLEDGSAGLGMHDEPTRSLKIKSIPTNQSSSHSELSLSLQAKPNSDGQFLKAELEKELRGNPTFPENSHREDDPLSLQNALNYIETSNSILGSIPTPGEFPHLNDPGRFSSETLLPFSIDPMLYEDPEIEDEDTIEAHHARGRVGASIMAAMMNSHRVGTPEGNGGLGNIRKDTGPGKDWTAPRATESPPPPCYKGGPFSILRETSQGCSPLVDPSSPLHLPTGEVLGQSSSPLHLPTRGVLAYPSLGMASFRMVGDSGRTCWVTAPRHRPGRRRLESLQGTRDYRESGGDSNFNYSEEEEEGFSSASMDDVDAVPIRWQGPSSLGLLGGSTRLKDLFRQLDESKAAAEENKRRRENADPTEAFYPPPQPSSSGSDELWVVKYAPRHFREVLSDEAINLRLLRWLKSWDPYVFQGGEGHPDEAVPIFSPSSTGSSHSHPNSSFLEGKGGPEGEKKEKPPVFLPLPPAERLALMVGPPGAGKTTLAHILAAHAGYEVVEVNASMERTSAQLEGIIRMAVSCAGSSPSSARLFSRRQGARGREGRDDSSHSEAPLSFTGPRASSASSVSHSTSLIEHLLRPKCLIIDEMDGMATGVGELLLNMEIRRPVFCLCNDFYASSLWGFRKRCQNVFFFPPIPPQRLLSRLKEIATKEGLAVNQAVLAEVIQASNGDVRSCLNTLQLIKSMPSSSSTNSHDDNQPHNISTFEEIRQIQGKDVQVDLWEGWRRVFHKMDRTKAIQQLKEFGIDYDDLIASASARGHPLPPHNYYHSFDQEDGMPINRKRIREEPRNAFVNDLSNVKVGERSTISSRSAPVKAAYFRFDPGYIYLSRLLGQRAGGLFGGRTFIDGLQDNFLTQPYSDYVFEHTNAVVEAFSTQNLFTARGFAHNTPGGINFAAKFELITALICHHHCGGRPLSEGGGKFAGKGGLHFPREQAQAQKLLNNSLSTLRAFREGCTSLEAVNHLWGMESLAGEVCPLLLRSLFDSRLRLFSSASLSSSSPSSYWTADLSSLPAVDQGYLKAALGRHVVYGLSYQKQTHQDLYFFNSLLNNGGVSNRVGFGSTPMTNGPLSSSSPSSLGEEGGIRSEETWVLTPSIDHVGGFHRHFIRENTRDLNETFKLTLNSSSSVSSNGMIEARPVLPLYMTMKDEIKQMLVGAIQRHAIMLKAKGSFSSSLQGENHSNLSLNNPGSASNAMRGVDNIKQPASPLSKRESTEDSIKDEVGSFTISSIAKKALLNGSISSGKETSEKTLVSGVKRDFFGRIISSSPRTGGGALKGSSTPTSSSFNNLAASRLAPLKTPVRYIYHDGSTNAVKFPATIHDF